MADRIVRAAMTETRNAYPDMPETIAELPSLRDRLDDVREANVAHHLELLGEAVERGARVVAFGELFPAPYFALSRDPMWHALAEDAARGPTIGAVRAAADRLDVVVVAPIYELDAETGRRFDTAVVIDADGAVLGKYRKAHVPVGENEQGAFDERFYWEPSDGARSPGARGENPFFPVFETSVARIGVATCYDRHFEGVVRSLARAGAEIVFSPAVTFGTKSRRMWDLEFPVDAARHGVFIGGSNRAGSEAPWNQRFFGCSYFVGPSGRPKNDSDHQNLVISDLDLGELSGPDPSGWDLARDARPGIYS